MYCETVAEAFDTIVGYYNSDKTGHVMLVNTENYDVYHDIMLRLKSVENNNCVYVSDYMYSNGLPNAVSAVSKVTGKGRFALVGLSEAYMLRSIDQLCTGLDEIVAQSVSGHVIVLVNHCEEILSDFIKRDIRLKNRILFVSGNASAIPGIRIIKTKKESRNGNLFESIGGLLKYLENIDDKQNNQSPSIELISDYAESIFSKSVFSYKRENSFDMLCNEYPDINTMLKVGYGTEDEWDWLLDKLSSFNSFSGLVTEYFGSTVNLSMHLPDLSDNKGSNEYWLLWLSLKAFGEKNNRYLTNVLDRCTSSDQFEKQIFIAFADVRVWDADFTRLYKERKKLLQMLPENPVLTSEYCVNVGKYQKDEVYYLTDLTDKEKYEFMRCLDAYDYTDEELIKAVNSMSADLSEYMEEFIFQPPAIKDNDLGVELTKYFNQYKKQKLTNRIYPDFLDTVNHFSLSRPYNKLSSRSSIVSHIDRTDTKLFFFDALGVEYLSFIAARCKAYGLMAEIKIGRCELPSITVKNKEFLQYYKDGDWYKIDDLDEMKHHSQIYDYEKCKYPIHLFEELKVIDNQIRSIKSMLAREIISKALIVSDHGASRLAVLYGQEIPASVALEESGQHSGRCCPAETDPGLSYAAYEDGYSVLANYERFKGSRKADVEVHGGATLEETLVPIIIISKQPDDMVICFVESVITLVPKEVPTIILYASVPLKEPKLLINGEFYSGSRHGDDNHTRFELAKIRRKGEYIAEVYEGDKNTSRKLSFTVTKNTREVDLF